MNRTKMHRKVRALGLALVAAAISLASGVPGDARADGLRLTVDVGEPFEFQGRVWPASKLSVIPAEVSYNPTSTLDEIWIGQECLGRMFADRQLAGSVPARDVIIFERNADRRLVLVGYALRGNNESFRYRVSPAVAAARVAGGGAEGRPRVASLR